MFTEMTLTTNAPPFSEIFNFFCILPLVSEKDVCVPYGARWDSPEGTVGAVRRAP